MKKKRFFLMLVVAMGAVVLSPIVCADYDVELEYFSSKYAHIWNLTKEEIPSNFVEEFDRLFEIAAQEVGVPEEKLREGGVTVLFVKPAQLEEIYYKDKAPEGKVEGLYSPSANIIYLKPKFDTLYWFVISKEVARYFWDEYQEESIPELALQIFERFYLGGPPVMMSRRDLLKIELEIWEKFYEENMEERLKERGNLKKWSWEEFFAEHMIEVSDLPKWADIELHYWQDFYEQNMRERLEQKFRDPEKFLREFLEKNRLRVEELRRELLEELRRRERKNI